MLRVLYFGWRRPEWLPLLQSSARLSAEVVSFELRRDGVVGSARKAIAAWRRGRALAPDILVVESLGPDALVAVALRWLLAAPLAVRVKGDLGRELGQSSAHLPWRSRLEQLAIGVSARLTLASADLVLPITAAVARGLAREWCAGAACEVVPIASPPLLRATRPGARRLLTVTNFSFWAKVEPLLRAVTALHPLLEVCDAEWDILGGGPHLAMVRARLLDFPRVRFHGKLPSAPFYAAGPILAYFSGLDGLPNVLLEGAAAGLAMVLNRGSAAAELVDGAGVAVVVNLADAASVRDQVRALLVSDARRAELGDRAEGWVSAHYAESVVGARLESVLLRAVGSRS